MAASMIRTRPGRVVYYGRPRVPAVPHNEASRPKAYKVQMCPNPGKVKWNIHGLITVKLGMHLTQVAPTDFDLLWPTWEGLAMWA
jgi:hypothetical protein